MPAQIIEKRLLGRNVDRAPFFLICKARRKKVCCAFASMLTFCLCSQPHKSVFDLAQKMIFHTTGLDSPNQIPYTDKAVTLALFAVSRPTVPPGGWPTGRRMRHINL